MEKTETQKQAIAKLSKMLKTGNTVYTLLRHVSKSGMMRRIDLYVFRNNEPRRISYLVASALGYKIGEKQGIVARGCGMDMGYHLVNNLSQVLFCPEKYTREGAYALKHEWL